MVDSPDGVGTAFADHDAFTASGEGFRLTTTVFDAVVQAVETDSSVEYTVVVHVPTLDAATVEDVGSVLGESWQETLTRRLEDAPKATRARIELGGFSVNEEGDELHIEYTFTWGNPARAADIAKTFIEYVEGTYVEGIVPGYDYEPPVSSLLAEASQSGEGGTPL